MDGERILALLIAASVLLTLTRQAFPVGPTASKWLDRAATLLMLSALGLVIGVGLS